MVEVVDWWNLMAYAFVAYPLNHKIRTINFIKGLLVSRKSKVLGFWDFSPSARKVSKNVKKCLKTIPPVDQVDFSEKKSTNQTTTYCM